MTSYNNILKSPNYKPIPSAKLDLYELNWFIYKVESNIPTSQSLSLNRI